MTILNRAMSPKERAELIREHINSCNNRRPKVDNCYEFIANQINLAEEEAFARGVETGWKDRENGYAEGFRSGELAEREKYRALQEVADAASYCYRHGYIDRGAVLFTRLGEALEALTPTKGEK